MKKLLFILLFFSGVLLCAGEVNLLKDPAVSVPEGKDWFLSTTTREVFELEKDPSLAELENFLIPTESVLPFPKLCVSESDEKKLFNGMAVRTEFPDGTYTIDQGGQFYGLAEVTDGKAKTKTKLC